MDQLLAEWYCDVCGNKIEDINKGYVIWKKTKELKSDSFKIVHKTKCDLNDHVASAALNKFLGEKGLAYLLSKFSIGPIMNHINDESYCVVTDFDEFVDFIRRVQTPFYEQARRHFSNEDVLDEYWDANEYLPYLPEELKDIITKYDENC